MKPHIIQEKKSQKSKRKSPKSFFRMDIPKMSFLKIPQGFFEKDPSKNHIKA
jgi:hypothetical protein